MPLKERQVKPLGRHLVGIVNDFEIESDNRRNRTGFKAWDQKPWESTGIWRPGTETIGIEKDVALEVKSRRNRQGFGA